MASPSQPKKIFGSSIEFSQHIEAIAVKEGIDCLTAILMYCEQEDLDPEDVAPKVTKQLKDKLEVEFASLGLLKKQRTLYDD